VTLGVSACLLGEDVRHDGGHARDAWVESELGRWVQWVSVCPEIEAGMGTPRPTIRLVDGERGPRVVTSKEGADLTDELRRASATRVASLPALDGFVLKKNSPSCGLERVRVYRENGHAKHRAGMGVFARALTSSHPLLPIEEEGRLNDLALRDHFLTRIFARNRLRCLKRGPLTRSALVRFHTAHKLTLRSFGEVSYQRLGRIVASFGTRSDSYVYGAYSAEFMRALRPLPTRKAHTNVLQHAFGYVKQLVTPREKREILAVIEEYRRGLQPVRVPSTLLRVSAARHEIDYLLQQLYFDPYPKELAAV